MPHFTMKQATRFHVDQILNEEKRRIEMESFTPNYIVYKNITEFWMADKLVEAIELKGKYGGCIYEPLGMDAARQVSTIADLKTKVGVIKGLIAQLE